MIAVSLAGLATFFVVRAFLLDRKIPSSNYRALQMYTRVRDSCEYWALVMCLLAFWFPYGGWAALTVVFIWVCLGVWLHHEGRTRPY